MSRQLEHKPELVTGWSRGIDVAIARRMVREGADVALTYVSRPDQAEATVKTAQAVRVNAFAIRSDSAKVPTLVAAVERTVQELGGIDILVNSAGIALVEPIDSYRPENFDRTLAVNVRAAFVVILAAPRSEERSVRITRLPREGLSA